MSRGIEIKSRRGVQLVALAFGVTAIGSGYWLITTGLGSPFIHCPRPLDPPVSYLVGAIRAAIGVGFLAAALRNLAGPSARDPVLVTMFLTLFASIAIGSSARALSTGVVYFGRSQCIEIGGPWSYGIAGLGIVAGTIALYAAVLVFLGDGDD
jgi:hypothetical protein